MSSLVSIIGIGDLTRKANELVVTTYRPLEIYTFLILEYFIKDFKSEFKTLSAEEVGFPRSANNIKSYTTKLITNDVQNTFKDENKVNYFEFKGPVHIRGCLNFNMLLRKFPGLSKRYETIKDGEKVKFLYLLPNSKTGQFLDTNASNIDENAHVISFKDGLPKDFDIDKYIHYDKQFTKSFIEPVKNILSVIDWDIEPRGKLF